MTEPRRPSAPAGGALVGDDRHFRVDSDVRAMAVSEHNVWLAHHDGDVSIRKTRTTELVHTIRPSHGSSTANVGRVWSMVVVPYADGSDHMWLGLSNGTIDVYDAVRFEKLHQLLRHTGGIYTLAEYGGYVFSGSNDFTIVVWSTERHRSVRQLCGHSSYVRCLYAEGSIAISGSDDHTIRVWEIPSGRLLQTQHMHHAGVSALARVGMHIWSGDDLGLICVWALSTYELVVKNEKAHTSRITTIKKVGSRVYIGSTDRKVSIWDAYGKTQLRVMEDHASWITCVACPAVLSRYFVWSSGADGAVRCWHHDEYKIMNGDAERFDDVRWYYTMHPPSQEQTTALLDQLHHQDTLLTQTKKDNDDMRCVASKSSQQAETLQRRLDVLEEECAHQRARADAAESLLAAKAELLTTKENELQSLSSKSVGSVTEVGSLKVLLEGTTAKLREEQRRADQAVAEKKAADALLVKIRDVKADEIAGGPCKGMPMLILNTPSDIGSSVLALHQDVRSLLQLNEALRDEVERYKGVLGIKTSTPYPILKLVSLAEDRVRENAPLYIAEPPPPPPPQVVVSSVGTSTTPTVASANTIGGAPSMPPLPPPAVPPATSASTNTPTNNQQGAKALAPTAPSSSSVAGTSSSTGTTLRRISSIASASSTSAVAPAATAVSASATNASTANSLLIPAPPLVPSAPAGPSPSVVPPPSAGVAAGSTENAGGQFAAPSSALGTVDPLNRLVIIQSPPNANVASSMQQTQPSIMPSHPLFTVDASTAVGSGTVVNAVGGSPYEMLHGGARWLSSNVADYVQERYHRKVTPLFGPQQTGGGGGYSPRQHGGGSSSTPRRDASPRNVSPRSHGRSSVRPATASGFGSATTRNYF